MLALAVHVVGAQHQFVISRRQRDCPETRFYPEGGSQGLRCDSCNHVPPPKLFLPSPRHLAFSLGFVSFDAPYDVIKSAVGARRPPCR